MSLEELVGSLSTLGIAHEVRRSGADGAVLLLPEYGRIFGIWPHWRAENALWVNPDFLQALRVGVKDDSWSNPGGDRIWLAPAEEFLAENGGAPPEIDPGRYVLSADRAAVSMTSRGEAWARRSGARVRFRITRRLRFLEEKDVDEACGPTWFRRAGCEEELDLEIEGKCPVAVQLWSIAQVPPGSRALAGRKKVLCLQDEESEHARLLVKACESPFGHSLPAGTGPGEISYLSQPGQAGARQRLQWKTALYAFSGRSAEMQQFAARMTIL